MTDLSTALNDLLSGHADPFGAGPSEHTDDVFQTDPRHSLAESTRRFYAEQGRDYRAAREARDKEAAR